MFGHIGVAVVSIVVEARSASSTNHPRCLQLSPVSWRNFFVGDFFAAVRQTAVPVEAEKLPNGNGEMPKKTPQRKHQKPPHTPTSNMKNAAETMEKRIFRQIVAGVVKGET